jgi:hypothetical protein
MSLQTIDPVALFGIPGCGCGCECCSETEMPDILWAVTVNGVQFVTDVYVLLAREYLPAGIADDHYLSDIKVQATLNTVTQGLAHTVTSESPSDRIFQSRYLDVLEAANLRVRPTTHDKIHAILNIAGRRVGNLMPMTRAAADSTTPIRCAK